MMEMFLFPFFASRSGEGEALGFGSKCDVMCFSAEIPRNFLRIMDGRIRAGMERERERESWLMECTVWKCKVHSSHEANPTMRNLHPHKRARRSSAGFGLERW